MLPLIIAAHKNKSFKTRLALSNNLGSIARSLGEEITDSTLTQIILTLLKDPEIEIKSSVLATLLHFLPLILPSKRTLYVSPLQVLSRDASVVIRSSRSSVILR